MQTRVRNTWLAGWGAGLAACGGANGRQQPTQPIPTPSPAQVLVGATWEAPQVVADAGARPDRCAEQQPLCYRSYVQTYPVVAVNARGQAVAVWQRYEGGGYHLMASRYEPRVGWAEPERILAETGSLEPRVAIDGQANALVVWWHGGAIHASYGIPGRAWGAPQALVSGRNPDLAMDEAGRAYLLWSSSQEGLYAMRFTSAGWTAPERVQAEDPSDRPDLGESDVAIAPNGSVLATWLRVQRGDEYDGHGRSSEVWLSRTQPGQAWAPPGRIGSIDGAESLALGSVASDSGGAVAFTTFGERDVHRWEVWGQNTVVPPGGTPSWTGPTHLSGPVTPRPPTTLKEFPVLASGGSGNATLVWTEGQDFPGQTDRYVIRARRFSAATSTWEETRSLADRPGLVNSRYGLRAAASPAGNAVAVWPELAGAESRFLASHFVPGTGWSVPEELRLGTISAPQIAMDAAGNAIVVWSEFGGDRMQIWSARPTAVTGPAR